MNATLERLAGKVTEKERLHSALLLAYVNALYRVLSSFNVPSPLYRILYDEGSNHVDLIETQGSACVPVDGALDISALDVVVISNLRDIPVLFEGETGVGKTYVSQSFLRTLFPKESYVSLRLSGNTFLNNIFQPFLEGSIERGMPVTKIKDEAVARIAGMFVDEINRGDPQNVLQLLDNELFNAGQFRRLGIRIPELRDGKVLPGGRQKSLAILAAQNPAAAADAKFTSTLDLDAAVDNRLLKVFFGNPAASAGTTPWLEEEPPGVHAELLKVFVELACRYLDVVPGDFAALDEDWLGLYAWIADPRWTDKPILYSGLELADAVIGVLGGDAARAYAHERQVAHDWCARLAIPQLCDHDQPTTERLKKLQEVIASFKVPVIFRDTVQIKKLADVLATLRTLRLASREKDPVQAYLGTRRIVTVREVAGAAALLVRNKQPAGAASAVPAVNEILAQYVALSESVQTALKYVHKRFVLADESAGIKRLVLAKALRGTADAATLRRRIVEILEPLGRSFAATEDVRNLLLVRTLADLLTLCGFLAEHAPEADAAVRGSDPVAGLTALFYRVRGEHALTLPDVYQHRIQRTLGG